MRAMILCVIALWVSSASAFNQAHVEQLIKIGYCVGCDLSGANLSGANLKGAILNGPTSAIPTSAVPTSPVPSSAVPTSTVPTSAVPTSAVPTSLIPAALPTLKVQLALILFTGEDVPGTITCFAVISI